MAAKSASIAIAHLKPYISIPDSPCAVQLFFGLMALAMVGVKYKSDKRDQYLQHGGWFVKVALWVLFNVLPFFFPASFVNGYGAHLSIFAIKTLIILDSTWAERHLRGLFTQEVALYLPSLGKGTLTRLQLKPCLVSHGLPSGVQRHSIRCACQCVPRLCFAALHLKCVKVQMPCPAFLE